MLSNRPYKFHHILLELVFWELIFLLLLSSLSCHSCSTSVASSVKSRRILQALHKNVRNQGFLVSPFLLLYILVRNAVIHRVELFFNIIKAAIFARASFFRRISFSAFLSFFSNSLIFLSFHLFCLPRFHLDLV